jgi:hypothetical protein
MADDMNNQFRTPLRSRRGEYVKRLILWIAISAAMAGVVLFAMKTYQSPTQETASRTARELAKKIDEANATGRALSDEARMRAAAHPDAALNEAEMKGMTSEQRADRRKELEDLWAKKSGNR